MESHFDPVFNKTITLLGLAEYAMMNINQLGEAPRQMKLDDFRTGKNTFNARVRIIIKCSCVSIVGAFDQLG